MSVSQSVSHTAQTKLSPVTAILDIWRTAEGPPSAGPPFLTLLYDHERFVPADQYLRPIGGLKWQHKAPRIIESVSFRTHPVQPVSLSGMSRTLRGFGQCGRSAPLHTSTSKHRKSIRKPGVLRAEMMEESESGQKPGESGVRKGNPG